MTKIERIDVDTGLAQGVDLSIDQNLDHGRHPRGLRLLLYLLIGALRYYIFVNFEVLMLFHECFLS